MFIKKSWLLKKRFWGLVALFGLAIVFVFSFTFWAEPIVILKNPTCACSTPEVSDRYDVPLQYQNGAFAGECVNSCVYRPAHIVKVNADEKSNRFFEIRNVLHEGLFWTAKIPTQSVDSVEILFETFLTKTNHVAMIFNFSKEPIILKAQSPSSARIEKEVEIRSLVVSPEAVPPRGRNYSLKNGLVGDYALMYRAMSFDHFKIMAAKSHHPMRVYKTKISKAESQAVMITALIKMSQRTLTTYQLLFNNCATSTLDLILSGKKLSRSPGWNMWNILDPLRGIPVDLSIGTFRSLHWWNLIEPTPELYPAPPKTQPPPDLG